jgi:hypothetical protein
MAADKEQVSKMFTIYNEFTATSFDLKQEIGIMTILPFLSHFFVGVNVEAPSFQHLLSGDASNDEHKPLYCSFFQPFCNSFAKITMSTNK